MNNLVIPSLIIVLLQDVKCVILINRSTTTKIKSKVHETRRSVIKSRDNNSEGPFGIDNRHKSL